VKIAKEKVFFKKHLFSEMTFKELGQNNSATENN
jgi:hypothetical protein